MIFILAPHREAAEVWLNRKGMDPTSAVILTQDNHAKAREYHPGFDTLIRLPGAPDDLFFELTVR